MLKICKFSSCKPQFFILLDQHHLICAHVQSSNFEENVRFWKLFIPSTITWMSFNLISMLTLKACKFVSFHKSGCKIFNLNNIGSTWFTKASTTRQNFVSISITFFLALLWSIWLLHHVIIHFKFCYLSRFLC